MRQWFLAATATLLLGSALALAEDKPKYVWIEGESAVKTNLNFNPWLKGDNAKLLSEGDAFSCNNERATLPSPGFVLWKITVPAEGTYHAYFRHGFKGHLGEIRYRFIKLGDDGKIIKKPGADEGWIKFDLDAAVIDQQKTGQFRTIEWTRQEPVKLEAGSYYLDLQVTGPNPNKSAEANPVIWTLIDCICLTPEPFTPNGSNKPGEKGNKGGGAGGADYLD